MIRVIPSQILNKLTASHCLFLGYAMHDWSLRVFFEARLAGRPAGKQVVGDRARARCARARLVAVVQSRSCWHLTDDYVTALAACMATPRADGS